MKTLCKVLVNLFQTSPSYSFDHCQKNKFALSFISFGTATLRKQKIVFPHDFSPRHKLPINSAKSFVIKNVSKFALNKATREQ